MRPPTDPGASPPSGDEVGGTRNNRKGPITGRDVAMVVGAVILAFSVAAYLNSELKEIRKDISSVRTAVHENARELAVVKSEISALRRDVERLEKQASIDDSIDGASLSMGQIAP